MTGPTVGIAVLAVLAALAGAAPSVRADDAKVSAAPANDYPTSARADYVFACMAANGQTREMLERCSCSIDAIAERMPYDRYVEAETIARMRQLGGEKSAIFRNVPVVNRIVEELHVAQTEAEVRCF